MKMRRNWTHFNVRKVTSKFMLLTFTAIVIYVSLNLFSFSSMSLKVDMYVKMQGVKITVEDIIRNSSYLFSDNKSETSSTGLNEEYKERKRMTNSGKIGNSSIHSFRVHTDVEMISSFSESIDRERRQGSFTNDGPDQFLPDVLWSKTVDIEGNDSFVENRENKAMRAINIFGNNKNGTDKKRKLECYECFQHNFNYVIENDICKVRNSLQILDLIVLVTTSHKNTKARAALRATWLSVTKKNTENIRYAFLFGKHIEKRYNELILKENDVYHDIIQEEFIDSYVNLTYKTIMGFKWAATQCSHARFVMKTDDDMFVNLPNVLRIINGPLSDTLQSAVAGSCTKKAKPIRHQQSKWYASIESYPQQVYPGFCSGTGYVTSMNVASKVYLISPNVPFFHLEDVYVALCLRKLGFKLQRIPGFNVGRRRMDPCLYKGRFLITAHHMSPNMLQMIWSRKCTKMHI